MLGALHQFHSGAASGDAITNQMLDLQRRLRRRGYYSEIYAQYIDRSLDELIKPLDALVDLPGTGLLVHHSMGHTAFDQLMASRLPMITVFHSITPAEFFDDEGVRTHVRLGFQQLRELARRSEFGLADSNHNRQQLYDAGFETVEVLPVRVDYSELHHVRTARTSGSHDWLFVGRVVPNKHQRDLVRAHSIYRRGGGLGQLHLVGDLSFGPYVHEVREEISRLDASSDVVLHGKVSQEDLLDRYRDANMFVCASEHEGFGVPLLEAMAAGLPVVARTEAAVAETMGGAGILIGGQDPLSVASVVRMIEGDPQLRASIVEHQDRRLEKIERFDVDEFLDRVVERLIGTIRSTTVQVQGPFETSYSLAVLNRELALALDTRDDLQVSIHATEGPGDYDPDPKDLAQHPEATELFERGRNMPFPEVAIRQMYPPRVADSTAGMTLQYFGWEESRLPREIVDDFNRHLDGIGTMSSFVREVLVDSGVTVPCAVVGVGVHAPDPKATCTAAELSSIRGTRILHISSAFPRKGVDVLLRAYFATFDAHDDVTLILKTFPNPHNDVATLLAELRARHPQAPDVCWINRDLGRGELDGLYKLASVYVHVARGEGFGLPVAEAMLAGVPVISVASTGLADFVSPATAAVVGHTMTPADTHLSVPGSEWAEPSIDDLSTELAAFVRGDDADQRKQQVERARSLIERRFSWTAVGERWHDFIVSLRHRRSGISVAAVTTYNSRCGIAEYAANLYNGLEGSVRPEIFADDNAIPVSADREVGVQRCWTNSRSCSIDRLVEALNQSTADLVHIQYNFGFFELVELARLIECEAPRRPVVVTLHRTMPLDVGDRFESMEDVAAQLRIVDAVIVHQEADRRRLEAAGVTDNVCVIPIGTDPPPVVNRAAARRALGFPGGAFVVGTFGFLLPHKGLIPIVRAVAELRSRSIDVRLVATCASHPDPSSAAHREEVVAEIERLGLDQFVHLATDFLERDDAVERLSAADVIVMPYEQTNESASAALRFVLPLGIAMVTSALPIFEDVAEIVPSLPSPVDPSMLADLLEELWLDEQLSARIARDVAALSNATSWARTAARTRSVYDEVLSQRRDVESPAMDV